MAGCQALAVQRRVSRVAPGCSQPSRRGQGMTKQLRCAWIEVCAQIDKSLAGGMILPVDATGLRSAASGMFQVAVMTLGAGDRLLAFESRLCPS